MMGIQESSLFYLLAFYVKSFILKRINSHVLSLYSTYLSVPTQVYACLAEYSFNCDTLLQQLFKKMHLVFHLQAFSEPWSSRLFLVAQGGRHWGCDDRPQLHVPTAACPELFMTAKCCCNIIVFSFLFLQQTGFRW